MAKWHVLSEEGDVSFVADVDLTGAQYKWVSPASTANNVQVANAASLPAPLGILQNSPSLGQEARVRMAGFSKAWIHQGTCTVQWGRYVSVASDGYTEATLVAGSIAFARYVGGASTTANGSLYGEVFIFPAGLSACPGAAS